MRAFWGVTTCPRPDVKYGYLHGFEAAFKAALPREPLHVFDDMQRRGQAQNFLRMLAVGVESGAEFLHTFEDDVLPCQGAFERVATQAIPTWAEFGDWCCLRVGGWDHGWWQVPTSHFLGLQAVTFKRRAAIEILADQRINPWPEKHLGDTLVARALTPGYYARHLPGIFEHVGADSVCNPHRKLDGERVSLTFDRSRDAAALGVFE